jgi:hypothetical protein
MLYVAFDMGGYMTLIDCFMANEKTLREISTVEMQEKLAALSAKFGEEKALVYIQAVEDIFEDLSRIVYHFYEDSVTPGGLNTAAMARTDLEKYIKKQAVFLDICNSSLNRKSSKNDNHPD